MINNFDPWLLPPGPVGSHPAERHRPSGEPDLRIVYAGNIGRFQNIPRLAEAMLHLAGHPDIFFEVVGQGPLLPWLQQFVRAHDLRNLPPDQLAVMMRTSCDVGMVSLQPGVIRNAYPSKTLSYLRNGLPVLALVESDSQLAETLRTYGAGWWADPTTPASLERIVEDLLDDPMKLTVMRARARSMYEGEFSPIRQLSLWRDLFADLTTIGSHRLAGARR